MFITDEESTMKKQINLALNEIRWTWLDFKETKLDTVLIGAALASPAVILFIIESI